MILLLIVLPLCFPTDFWTRSMKSSTLKKKTSPLLFKPLVIKNWDQWKLKFSFRMQKWSRHKDFVDWNQKRYFGTSPQDHPKHFYQWSSRPCSTKEEVNREIDKNILWYLYLPKHGYLKKTIKWLFYVIWWCILIISSMIWSQLERRIKKNYI